MPEIGQPQTRHVPWYRRAGVWIGIGINPGSITVGGGLASQLPLSVLLFLIPVGAVILTSLAISQGIVSRRRREPLAKRAANTFGPGFGARLLNLLIAFGMIGWGSFYVGIAGFSLANLFGLPGWIGALVIAGSVFILGELGLNRWNSLVWVTTLSALGVAIVALIAVGAKPAFEVTTNEVGLYELLWVTGSIVAYATLFTLRCGDFTWDLKADSDVVKVGFSLFIPMIISIGIGAVLYQTVGDWNLADILVKTHLAALGQLFLLASIASPSLSGLHSGALAIQNIASLSKRQSTGLICVVNFILGATRFDYQLLPFLDLIGAILPPALVVLLSTAILSKKPSPAATLTAWLVGAAIALVFKLQGQLIHIAVGAVVSLIVLQIMIPLSNNKEL